MSLTKRELALSALKELGVAQTGLDITAAELLDSCAVLDAMMASWDADGIHIGWPITDSIPVDVAIPTGAWASALRAIRCNLALELAPMFNIANVSPMTLKNANAGLNTLRMLMTTPRNVRTRTGTPLGAGQSRFGAGISPAGQWGPFVNAPDQEITVGDDSVLDLE